MDKTTKAFNNCNVGLTISGGDGIPVFLFHGNSSSGKAFEKIMSKNNGKYKMIAVDLPGHGSSTIPHKYRENGLSVRGVGSFCEEIVREFASDKFVLVGQSIGGHAILESDFLTKNAFGICLLSSPPISPETLPAVFRESEAMPLLFKENLTSDEISVLANYIFDGADESNRNLVENDIRNTDGTFRQLLELGIQNEGFLDEIKAYSEAKNEILMIKGRKDKFINSNYYDCLPSENIWQGKAFEEDCGHIISLEAPDRIWGLLNAYVNSIESTNSYTKELCA